MKLLRCDKIAPFYYLKPTLSKLWIKICGITRKQDAIAATELGADAVGLVFYKRSPRSVTLSQAGEIITGVSSNLKTVGLFVNPEHSAVFEVVESGLLFQIIVRPALFYLIALIKIYQGAQVNLLTGQEP